MSILHQLVRVASSSCRCYTFAAAAFSFHCYLKTQCAGVTAVVEARVQDLSATKPKLFTLFLFNLCFVQDQ